MDLARRSFRQENVIHGTCHAFAQILEVDVRHDLDAIIVVCVITAVSSLG